MEYHPEVVPQFLLTASFIFGIFVFILWGFRHINNLRKKGTRLILAEVNQKPSDTLLETTITNASCVRVFGDYAIKGFSRKSSTVSITLDNIDQNTQEVVEMAVSNSSDNLSIDPGSYSLYTKGTNVETMKLQPQQRYKMTISHFYQNPFFKKIEVRVY